MPEKEIIAESGAQATVYTKPSDLMLFYDYDELTTKVQQTPKVFAAKREEALQEGNFAAKVQVQGKTGKWEHDFFMLQINPRTLKVGKSKITIPVLTKGGYETLHWGIYDMIPYSYIGSTSRCDIDFWGRAVTDIRDSFSWKYFECFKAFVDQRVDDIVMVYRGKIYSGYFKDFGFDESGDRPFAVEYSFTFLVYPDREEISIEAGTPTYY